MRIGKSVELLVAPVDQPQGSNLNSSWRILLRYKREADMYHEASLWLQGFLKGYLRGAHIEVHDTHALDLKNYIGRYGLERYFPIKVWQTYEIRVDITAFVFLRSGEAAIVFLECKNRPIALRDLAQLLGYCRVARPLSAYLISPFGVGGALRTLIFSYGRGDVLEYEWPRGTVPRHITLGKWDSTAKTVVPASLWPPIT